MHIPTSPDLVPHEAVDQKVGRRDGAKQDVIDVAWREIKLGFCLFIVIHFPPRIWFHTGNPSPMYPAAMQDLRTGRFGAGERRVQSYLMVSMMIRSYIMMMILGRLLRMNISAIMMRTSDSLCSLALSDYYLPFLFNFINRFRPENSLFVFSSGIFVGFLQKNIPASE